MMNAWNLCIGAIVAVTLVACGDDTNADPGTGGAGSTTTTSGTTSGNTTAASAGGGDGGGGAGGQGGQGGQGGANMPAAPELGEQVDRMGRAAVNTALNDTFLYVDGAGDLQPSNDPVRTTSQDAYNGTDNADGAQFASTIALQLGVLDALDGECSNQEASCDDPEAPPAAGCYATLAGYLANDALWVNSDYETCDTYLGVELEFFGASEGDCGGRRPIDDVIKTTYSLVSGAPEGFDDGIAPSLSVVSASSVFPYMAPPLD